MRFYFDIDEAEFEDEYGMGFSGTVKQRVCEAIADDVWNRVSNPDSWYSDIKKNINNLLQEHQREIIEAVIERVSEKIAAKKAVVALTPKVSDIVAMDKDNIDYFEKMIDKAIAKRFK